MSIKKIPLLLLMLASLFTYSQEGIPVYTDYLADNMYILHPSMAGIAPGTRVRLLARQQWFDQQNAPNMQVGNVTGRFSERSGFGAMVYNDQNGYHSQTGGYITYAHHIKFSELQTDLNQLSFGLSVGLTQSSLDETHFDPDIYDPVVSGIMQSSSYFNIDAGMSYHLLDFSFHVTVKNILLQNRSIYTERYEPNNQRKYLISTAYALGAWNKEWTFEPSVMFQITERTGEKAFDLNFKAFRHFEESRLWGGLSYRQSLDGADYVSGTSVNGQKLHYFTPFIGINYQNFVFAYMYSYQSGTATFDQGGYHQVTLGYNFGKQPKDRMDCNCPNVN